MLKVSNLSDIDVSTDIMQFYLSTYTDLDINQNKFYLTLKEWTDIDMKIHINFTDPLVVSAG